MEKIFEESNGQISYIKYIPNVFNSEYLNEIKLWLKNQNFIRGNIKREQLWFEINGNYFQKNWKTFFKRWESNKYDKFLLDFQNKVQKLVNNLNLNSLNLNQPNINSCLINKYKDGNDFIKAHKDSNYSFGDYPTIIGISIGDIREIIFKRAIDNNFEKNFKLKLESGSMFIMAGATQKYFTHEIPKCNSKNIRYSFTLREYIR